MTNQENNTENKSSIKMWLSLLAYAAIGLLLGYGVAKGVLYMVNKSPAKQNTEEVRDDNTDKGDDEEMSTSTSTSTPATVGFKTYVGSYSSNFEGANKGSISFLFNEKYSVDQGAGTKNKFFYVKDEKGNIIANIYASYEGGRGYTGPEYIKDVIGKAVKLTGTTADIAYSNNVYSSNTNGNSIWNTISSSDKQWLIVIESKKANQEKVKLLFETLTIK